MDAQDLMSATASISLKDKVIQTPYWKAFAPKINDEYILSLVREVVEKPLFTLKSYMEDVELRFQIEDRLGIVGVLKKGEVAAAFPFVRTGFEQEMEIVDIVPGPSEVEAWVVVRGHGMELSFHDVLHALVEYEVGEKRLFVLNALAYSIKQVSVGGVDEVEMGISTHGIRSYIPNKGQRRGEGIFQSPVDGDPSGTQFDGSKFTLLPISLTETTDPSATIDLAVAPEVAQQFERPLRAGDEIAGVLWLHGYSPDLLQKRPD